MNYITEIFNFYDKLIINLPVNSQIIISLLILIFFIWQIFMFIKSGHWIFIVALLLFLPGTTGAIKNIGFVLLSILKSLLIRIQLFF